MNNYEAIFKKSIQEPELFWDESAQAISWFKKYDRVLDDSNPPFYRWFVGGQLNICYNALDRHIEAGRGEQTALIWDSPVTNQIKKYSYRELTEYVAKFAAVLKSFGVKKGDTVVIYMSMVPEAVVAMLACARIGAIHSVVFGGFAANELAVRIDDAKPKLIIATSCGIEVKRIIDYKSILDKALEMAVYKPEACIIFQRPQSIVQLKQGFEYDWNELMNNAQPVDCVSVESTHPLYILYTSGTTGKPKGVVRDSGGYAVALRWSMENIYDIKPGDVFWAASDVGWVVGHSYIVYAPLITGCTTIVYEGKSVGTPDPGAFWRVISQHRVKALFTAPTAFRAIKREDPNGEYLKKYNISDFKYLFLAGERLDPDTYYWASNLLNRPVIDHWWQTETGWPITANCMGIEQFPIKAGSSTKPVPGYSVHVVDANGNILAPEQEGLIVIKLPLPPGTLPTLWNAENRYLEAYIKVIPGYYFTADGGYIDRDGYVFIMGRVDDVINVAGHRLSTGAMEEVISKHPDVAECAVFGIEDSFKGQLPLGLIVLKAGVNRDPNEIKQEIAQMVRNQIGPIACYRDTIIVERLPKTRSGKILRGILRKIADGQSYTMPATIDDPAILIEIEEKLRSLGFGKKV